MADAKDALMRIASLIAHGVADSEIQRAYGLTKAEFELLIEDDEFKEILSGLKSELLEQRVEADSSWDGLERLALTNLHMAMQKPGISSDPKLNLAVAQVANKAMRRQGSANRTPIDGATSGPVTIVLDASFVSRLNAAASAPAESEVIEAVHKVVAPEPPVVPEQRKAAEKDFRRIDANGLKTAFEPLRRPGDLAIHSETTNEDVIHGRFTPIR